MEKAKDFIVDCGIMEDLLPLYVDEVCTESSRQAIEVHLTGCRECQLKLAGMQGPDYAQPVPVQQEQEKKALKKSFGRIRRRWMISLTAVLMIFPLICVGMMSVNEYRKEGMCFTNLDEIATAKAFLKELQKGQYEKAAERIPFAEGYWNIMGYEYEVLREDFTEINLSDGVWMVSSLYPRYDEYKGDLDIVFRLQEEDEETFWRNIIYGYEWGVPVPEAVWEAIVGENTVTENRFGTELYFAGEDSTEVYNRDESGFGRLETEWGVYYMDVQAYQSILAGDEDRLLEWFYYNAKMMPEAIYQAAKAHMPQVIEQQNAAFYDWYGDAFSMTEEDYVAEMQERFVQSMESYENCGYSFADISFEDAYCYSDGEWCIVLSAKEENPAGQKEKITLHVSVNGEQVRVGAWSSGEDRDTLTLGETVNVHYTPKE